jgi:outer membrane protein insertion porin family
MGTGRTAGFNFNTSYWGKNYAVNFYDPFYRENIGRGFNIFYQTVDPSRLDISSFTTDKYGFNINYNILIGNTASIQLGYGLDRLKITSLGSNPATQLASFVNTYGRRFDQLKLTAGWNHNTYDQLPYPTKGFNEQFSALVALPVSAGSLKYYKLSYMAHGYYPIGHTGFIFTALGNVSVGSMFNKKALPFFENYFAGGIAQPGQVRGFESFSLGPLDSTGNNLGGNLLVNGSVGIIMPRPLSRETVRTTAFIDFGNVYSRGLPASMAGTKSGPIRYSAGISVDWRSPFGPLSFSIAKPIKQYRGDQTNYFQFNVSSGF